MAGCRSVLHAVAGFHRGQYCGAGDGRGAQGNAAGHAHGAHQLCADPGDPDSRQPMAMRPPGYAPGIRHRHCGVRRGLAVVRRRADAAATGCGTRTARYWRGLADAGGTLRAGAQYRQARICPRDEHGRYVRLARLGTRAIAGRCIGGVHLVAADFPDQ